MTDSGQIWFGQFRLDVQGELLWHTHERLSLSPKAFAILRYLVEHQGQLVTKASLLETIWPDTVVGDGVLGSGSPNCARRSETIRTHRGSLKPSIDVGIGLLRLLRLTPRHSFTVRGPPFPVPPRHRPNLKLCAVNLKRYWLVVTPNFCSFTNCSIRQRIANATWSSLQGKPEVARRPW
jgi:hypothetical protein